MNPRPPGAMRRHALAELAGLGQFAQEDRPAPQMLADLLGRDVLGPAGFAFFCRLGRLSGGGTGGPSVRLRGRLDVRSCLGPCACIRACVL